jgi:hypothetical protein
MDSVNQQSCWTTRGVTSFIVWTPPVRTPVVLAWFTPSINLRSTCVGGEISYGHLLSARMRLRLLVQLNSANELSLRSTSGPTVYRRLCCVSAHAQSCSATWQLSASHDRSRVSKAKRNSVESEWLIDCLFSANYYAAIKSTWGTTVCTCFWGQSAIKFHNPKVCDCFRR